MAAAAPKEDALRIVAAAAAPPTHGDTSPWTTNWLSCWLLIWQAAMIILYGTCTAYAPGLSVALTSSSAAMSGVTYSMFQDTHVMMAVGFGFLYTLLRRYAWSGVAWNLLILVCTLQWGILTLGFWRNVMNYRQSGASPAVGFPAIELSLTSLVDGDYTVATVLISFGAVIGRFSAAQCAMMAFVETIFATANVVIGLELGVTDPGGSMLIHCFGAAFGLALALVYGDAAVKGRGNGEAKLGTSRHNGTFAMIGTAFLWLFWPSFNAALIVNGAAQQRAVLNTVLSISASAVVSFAFSKAIGGGKAFNMEHIQNAVLAGGVAIGACCDMTWNLHQPLLIGACAGVVSSYGFSFLSPWLKARGLTDVCGIANLHFLPGVMGGFASAAMAAMVTPTYGWSAGSIDEYPGRAWGRSALTQGGYQAAMTVISVAFGAISGAATAPLLKLAAFEPMRDSFYEDAGAWAVPFDPEEVPEQNADVTEALQLAKADVRAAVLAQVSAAFAAAGIKVDPALLRAPPATPASRPGTPLAAEGAPASPRRSANLRFTEGSVHGGTAGGAAAVRQRKYDEGSVRAGQAHAGTTGVVLRSVGGEASA